MITKDIAKAQIKEIVELLIKNCEFPDDRNARWATDVYIDGNKHKEYYFDLYKGNSGILLFLIETYNVFKEEEILVLVEKGINWVLDNYKDCQKLQKSLYSGSLGICYLLKRVYEITGDNKYKNEISTVFEHYLNSNFNGFYRSEILDGLSGQVLGMLQITKYVDNKKLSTLIDDSLTSMLSSSTTIYNYGIGWGNGSYIKKPLVGLSHGTIGVGLAYLEAGQIMKNNALLNVAELAFKYVDAHFDPNVGNWKDLRYPYTQDYLKQKYYKNPSENKPIYINEYGYSNSWCHGCGGIGYGMLRAWEILKEEKYINNVNIIAEKIILDIDNSDINTLSLCLCHGICGDLDLLIEIENTFSRDYKKHISYGISKILEQKENCPEKYLSEVNTSLNNLNLSLFTGLTGLGYLFLRYVDNNTPSILYPSMENLNLLESKVSHSQLNNSALKSVYPKTVSIMETQFPEEHSCFIQQNKTDPKIVERFANLVISLNNKKHTETALIDFLTLETSINQIKLNNDKSYLRYLNEYGDYLMSASFFKTLHFYLNKKAYKILNLSEEIFFTKVSQIKHTSKAKLDVLVFGNENGENYKPISEFLKTLLNLLSSERYYSFEEIFDELKKHFSEVSKGKIEALLQKQIIELIKIDVIKTI